MGAMMKQVAKRREIMRVQARAGSYAARQHQQQSGLPSGSLVRPKAIAPGINPAPLDDLIYMGGKIIPQMGYQNIFLGGDAAWTASDTTNIESAIKLAMHDRKLNNVMRQYFPGAQLSCDALTPFIFDEPAAKRIDEASVLEMLTRIFDSSLLPSSDLSGTIFNFILPPGAVLALGSSSSTQGLGGFHGSLHLTRAQQRITLYYSANVYSQTLPNGRENGINVFDQPWKNVVATLYHELNEFRTDPDVDDANRLQNDDFLGWISRDGGEVGDQPITAADQNLSLVFKEVLAGNPRRRVPVQLMYSNAVHGAEGPIARPHA
jgi:hypothetical protein